MPYTRNIERAPRKLPRIRARRNFSKRDMGKPKSRFYFMRTLGGFGIEAHLSYSLLSHLSLLSIRPRTVFLVIMQLSNCQRCSTKCITRENGASSARGRPRKTNCSTRSQPKRKVSPTQFRASSFSSCAADRAPKPPPLTPYIEHTRLPYDTKSSMPRGFLMRNLYPSV